MNTFVLLAIYVFYAIDMGLFTDFLKKINNSKTLAVLLLEIGRGGWEIFGELGLLEPKFGSEPEVGLSLTSFHLEQR